MQVDLKLVAVLAALACAAAAPPGAPKEGAAPPSACPAGAIRIATDQPIQLAVNQEGAGASFCLAAGVHRLQWIVPKSGQSFYGEGGSILSGAKIIASFEREGSYWVATGQTQHFPTRGQCAANSPACNMPEGFFIDDRPLKRVLSKSEVTSGSYYLDYATARLYFADDPEGHKVEAAVTPLAFNGPATDVLIANLIVEKYANPAQLGPINGRPTSQWTVKGVESRWNSGAGMTVGSGGRIVDCKIHHNGQLGINAGGTDIVIEKNEVWENNIRGFDYTWEAGGVKITGSDGVKFLNNHVHHNGGPGLWCDIECHNVLYENNLVEYNAFSGILHEISYDATIRNNVTRFNGQDYRKWFWGAEIQISSSESAEVYGNTVTVAPDGNGIVLVDQNRETPRGTRYKTQNNSVHDNTIIFEGDGQAGGAVDTRPSAENYGIIAAGNNHFDRNTYRSPDGDRSVRFAWGPTDRLLDFSEFRKLGQEANGQILTSVPAKEGG